MVENVFETQHNVPVLEVKISVKDLVMSRL